MEYTIIEDSELRRFVEAVNRHIQDGWLPQGGVAYTVRDSNFDADIILEWYVQAMTRAAAQEAK